MSCRSSLSFIPATILPNANHNRSRDHGCPVADRQTGQADGPATDLNPLIVASDAMAADRPVNPCVNDMSITLPFLVRFRVCRETVAQVPARRATADEVRANRKGVEFNAAIVYLITVGPRTPGGNGGSSRASRLRSV